MTEAVSGANYTWGNGGGKVYGNGVANITFSPWVPVADADQVAVALIVTPGAGVNPFRARAQWSTDAATAVPESVEAVGGLAGTVQQFLMYTKEWGDLALAAGPFLFYLSTALHFFRLGIYSNGAVDASTTIAAFIARQAGAKAQLTGL
jgi:hypothetical protein